MIDREALYGMLAVKDWDGIVKELSNNYKEIHSDPVSVNAIKFFESEFFDDLCGKSGKEALGLLELPYILIQINRSAFSEGFKARLVEEKLITLDRMNRHEIALDVAFQHQALPVAQEFISRIQKDAPEVIANTTRQYTDITATHVGNSSPATRRLFRSEQEENFFLAMRSAFPTYDPYPNVALNTVINFDLVRDQLSEREREYFFRALVDSVVFDPNTGYTPMYFFELDSRFHDDPTHSSRDKMKDTIFEVANVKLHRIRGYDKEAVTMSSFRQLILDLVRDL